MHFLQVHDRTHLEIKVWERGVDPDPPWPRFGVGGGTGACATLVAASLLGLSDDHAEVMLPGGPTAERWSIKVDMGAPRRDGLISPVPSG